MNWPYPPLKSGAAKSGDLACRQWNPKVCTGIPAFTVTSSATLNKGFAL